MSFEEHPFNPPSEWCDRQCERCLLTEGCSLFARERGRRWAHQMRGVDPDAPAVMGEDFADDIDSAQAMLEEMVREDGIDLSAPLPKVPVVLDAVRLDHTAIEFAKATATDPELRPLVYAMVGKVARVAGQLDLPADDPSWLLDVVPNLFLIEYLRAELQGLLGMRGRLDALETLSRLERILDARMALIAPHRPALDALIAQGRAPSPFCMKKAEAEAPAS